MAPFSKPETVLKQAESLISVGQTHAALQSLSEMFSSKRFRSTPVTSLEPILIRFMELCVELRKGRTAKEGLMQFKNLAQNTNVGSIEVVVEKFIEMAEGKVREGKEKVVAAAAAAMEDVDDLEAPSTPESILLSSVSVSTSSTGSDRTSRALITPSLKFLWESYRTSLETLKNNSRLEMIYQSVAQKAFTFCLVNGRKTEFRRLCETLRVHLANVGKYYAQNSMKGEREQGGHHQINLGDPETLQRHLDTRFAQLNVSVELELWQEAFRSIEDIHNLLTMASSMPSTATTATTTAPTTTTTTTSSSSTLTIKSTMMANYYEKLSQVFLMSGNALYHAAAWAKYYDLVTYAGANASAVENREVLAGKVIVSALAVPVGKTTTTGGGGVHSRLSALLNLPSPAANAHAHAHSTTTTTTTSTNAVPPPTRSDLLSSALERDVLRLAPETVKKLYEALQVDFDPLELCVRVGPLLRELELGKEGEGEKSSPYAPYLPLLHQSLLSRLLTHLSEVYSSIKIDFLLDLVAPLTSSSTLFTPASIESYIMACARRGDVDLRIDHAERGIVFVDEPFSFSSSSSSSTSSTSTSTSSSSGTGVEEGYRPVQASATDLVRTRLSKVAECLEGALGVLEGKVSDSVGDGEEVSPQSQIQTLLASLPAYRKKLLLHQSITARRRQLQQELNARAQAQSLTMQAEAMRRAKEQARLLSLVEAREREAARRKAELEQIRRTEAEKYAKGLLEGGMSTLLKGMGKEGREAVEKLTSTTDPLDTSSIIKMQVLALEKDKSLRTSRLKTISKRMDHLERAYRKEEKEREEREKKEKEEKERDERRKEREREREKDIQQSRMRLEREEEAERRRSERAKEKKSSTLGASSEQATRTGTGNEWRKKGPLETNSTPSGTPANSVPGTPTTGKSMYRSGSRVDGGALPPRAESPAPAQQKYVPGALGGGAKGGWRDRVKAQATNNTTTSTTTSTTMSTSNVPSRTASPAPGIPNTTTPDGRRKDEEGGDIDNDGFTLVGGNGSGGGEKKNVWKPSRGRGRGGFGSGGR
ncbi:hypothetical protein GGU11DRAFT_423034 [Lentinula aff. detonsa]|nr:hypothetical protein GGU11DRAFT_423034 [Lentinula aff. detonsa]